MSDIIRIESLSKRFQLHNQGGAVLEVLRGVDLVVAEGECVVLNGPSGAGKSSLLRCVYGNYRVSDGRILVRHGDGAVDMAAAEPREILDVRRRTLGYVSQFLRVIPRVSTIDVVAEPLRRSGQSLSEARDRAAIMLDRLNVPERLWPLAPATFSGGEQQRVNIARAFVSEHGAMLLDEPTSALDQENGHVVIDLIRERVERGTAVIGIFHDAAVRKRVADRLFDMAIPREAA